MSTSDLQQSLLKKIDAGLQELEIPAAPVSLYEPYRYALSVGGKRIRPYLTLLANGLCGGELDEALPAALAVEILHNFTLVHDDIMDRAETRRGQPSVYKKWDQNIAILSGDVMFADACRQLRYYGTTETFTKKEFSDLHNIFLETTITVCEGQALDMEFVDAEAIAKQEYLEMIGGKTAALLQGALEMGAIVAHSSDEDRQKLSDLGYQLGIAFQIQDDLLDATADPEKFGKRSGGDIYEGKKTYLTILALERANREQAEVIKQTLSTENPAEEQVERVLGIMKNLGVLDEIAMEVANHYEKAFNLLALFPDSEYKQELEQLLSFLKQRDH